MSELPGFTHVIARYFLALLMLTLVASVAHAQQSALVLVLNVPRYEGAMHRALRRREHSIEVFRCDPAEQACARDYLAPHANAQLLFVSVTRERRRCVRMGGQWRMPVDLHVVVLRLYDPEGTMLRETRATHPAEPGADVDAIVGQQVRAFISASR